MTVTIKSREQRFAETSAVYVQGDSEGMRIVACMDDHFLAEGEETGEQYQIMYTDIDLENDMFYKFTLVTDRDI